MRIADHYPRVFGVAVGVFALSCPVVFSIWPARPPALPTALVWYLGDIILAFSIAALPPLLAAILGDIGRGWEPEPQPVRYAARVQRTPVIKTRRRGRAIQGDEVHLHNWRVYLSKFWLLWAECGFCGRDKFNELAGTRLTYREWRPIMDRLEALRLIEVRQRAPTKILAFGKHAPRALIRNATFLPLPRSSPDFKRLESALLPEYVER